MSVTPSAAAILVDTATAIAIRLTCSRLGTTALGPLELTAGLRVLFIGCTLLGSAATWKSTADLDTGCTSATSGNTKCWVAAGKSAATECASRCTRHNGGMRFTMGWYVIAWVASKYINFEPWQRKCNILYTCMYIISDTTYIYLICNNIWKQYKHSHTATFNLLLTCLQSVQLQFSLRFTFWFSFPFHPFCSDAHLVSAIQLLQGQGVLEQPDGRRWCDHRSEGHLRSRRHWVLVDPGAGATSTTGSSKGLGNQ